MRTRREFLSVGASALAASLSVSRAAGAQAPARPRRILLLGGTGFIGPHLVHEALARGHQVAMLNRGRREPTQNAADFARVEALRGDRSTPEAYAALQGRTWDAVIDTATNLTWTQEGVAALKGSTRRYMYVSSTGVFWPYRQLERYAAAGLDGRPDYWCIPEDGVVPLQDDPPQEPPTYGVLKARSEKAVRDGFPGGDLIIRPGYIVGPGDTSDRFTYWPVRLARGGEVLVPGKKGDFVQYVDVRDLAAFMIASIEKDAAGTFNVTGPATPQTLAHFIDGLRPLAPAGTTYTWIEDYAFLQGYALRPATKDDPGGLIEAIPWVMPTGTELGHLRIDVRKAVGAGLTYRPLLTTARDTLAWRQSPAVPPPLRETPRYVLTEAQEKAILAKWRATL
jgi:2'-hydroxyisoflavone reductase